MCCLVNQFFLEKDIPKEWDYLFFAFFKPVSMAWMEPKRCTSLGRILYQLWMSLKVSHSPALRLWRESCFVPCGSSVKPAVLGRENDALLYLFYSDGPSRPKVAWGTNQMKHSARGELWQVEIAETVSNVVYGGYTAPALHAALWVGACWKGTPRSAWKIRNVMQEKRAGRMPKALLSPYAVCQRSCLWLLSLALFCVCVFYNGFSEHSSLRVFSCRYDNEVMWIKHRRSFQSTISVHGRIQGSSRASQNPQDTGAIL